MSCRIEVSTRADFCLVRIAGRLTEAETADLLGACAVSVQDVELDLSDLDGVDCVGLDALRRVRDRGARLLNLPQYIRLQLEPAR